MPQPLASLSSEPLKRLQVADGLLLTAERWRIAHDYHRKRQNVHYQSLNQAGIVDGLGVCLIPAPSDITAEYRDGRWLQIQPGVAIDGSGNPIVVPEPIAFRIASPAPESGLLTVYISLKYVDPDLLQGQGDRDLVQETFRIDESLSPPSSGEVELCRVRLQPGEVRLMPPIDVLNPSVNTLDLRDRQSAKARPGQQVWVASVSSTHIQSVDARVTARLQSLLRSLTALYPSMQGAPVQELVLSAPDSSGISADLLYLTWQQLQALTADEKLSLQNYVATGTVILVEVSVEEAGIAELSLVYQQLQTAIANLAQETNTAAVRRDLETELTAVTVTLQKQIQETTQMVQDFGQYLDGTAPSSGLLGRDHPLRLAPFLFAQFPSVQGYPVQLFNWGGLILSIGSLSQAWDLDDSLSLPRETIRSAQELGINLLYFSWRRRQLTQLQRLPSPIRE